ncbi:rhamnulokinase [Anaeromicropila populeti]|uniref:L-fuculokinase n=1 Tax=Anaeromicropila populeti TaxID=37658 RepID=A0A1I6K0A4_9FIRM|nr:rhamnulokinase family protein [Anaeromicropila populeti]SFR84614.1 L-fuculokinase [Anaeromicropila populeti]
MKKKKQVLAFDLGGSSGRAMIGSFDGKKISLEEIHRFSNDPVEVNGTLYWDVLRLFYELQQGILKAKNSYNFDSIAVDTWGVDFGILDQSGKLIENPVHYRDSRTKGMLKRALERMTREELYGITGNQFMEINTAFQLLSYVEERADVLQRADKILLMPDLLNYMLTGIQKTEYSIATTTQLLDAKRGVWSEKIIDCFQIPKHIFTDIIPTGSVVGELSERVSEMLGVKRVPVIAVAGHDTQCAMAAVPAEEKDFIFISCGTWSLFGTELDQPVLTKTAEQCELSNEGGYGRKASFLKNIIGLWLVQESKRQWEREGKMFTFSQLEQMAEKSTPFKCFIDPDAPEFVPAGNIPERIRQYCIRTNQEVPETEGEIVRCINESIAFKYRIALEQIEQCTNKKYEKIYMMGGGTNSRLLCQLTANACGCPVHAGPAEATALGNVGLQLLTLMEIRSLEELRKVIRDSSKVIRYENIQMDEADQAYKRYVQVIQAM